MKKNYKKKQLKAIMKWHEERLVYKKHLMLKLWQMSHIAARASCGNMAGVGLI